MNRPRTTINMDFDPEKWLTEKGDEKLRPALTQVIYQKPLDPDGPVPFTAFYFADDRLYRVSGVAPDRSDVAGAIAFELEKHWWRYDPGDDLELPF